MDSRVRDGEGIEAPARHFGSFETTPLSQPTANKRVVQFPDRLGRNKLEVSRVGVPEQVRKAEVRALFFEKVLFGPERGQRARAAAQSLGQFENGATVLGGNLEQIGLVNVLAFAEEEAHAVKERSLGLDILVGRSHEFFDLLAFPLGARFAFVVVFGLNPEGKLASKFDGGTVVHHADHRHLVRSLKDGIRILKPKWHLIIRNVIDKGEHLWLGGTRIPTRSGKGVKGAQMEDKDTEGIFRRVEGRLKCRRGD